MTAKNRPPEEWVRLQREAGREVKRTSAAGVPRRLIAFFIVACLLVVYVAWSRSRPAEAGEDVGPAEAAEDATPRVRPLRQEEKRREAMPPVAPPADGGVPLPGAGRGRFDPVEPEG